METVLMIALIAAGAAIVGLLTAPMEKKRELVPIRIRAERDDRRRRR